MINKTAPLVCLAILISLLCGCAQTYAPMGQTTQSTTTVAIETTETVEMNTTEPASVPTWKTAYQEFLEGKDGDYVAFALVLADGDGIPELYLKGCSEAIGDVLCTFQNEKLAKQYLRCAGGGSYIPQSGQMINISYNQGHYLTEIFQLADGKFTCLWNGLEKHGLINQDRNLYTDWATYWIDDTQVGKEEYNRAIGEVIDLSKTVSFDENAVSYEEIRQQINDY